MAVVKGFGALLVLCGALSLGRMLCGEEKRRIAALQELLSVLEQLQGELELRSPPLPELFIRIAERSRGEACAFLRGVAADMERLGEESFSALWRRQVQRCLSSLATFEQDELIFLGRVLGRLDLEAELRALDACRAALTRQLNGLREQAPVRRRLVLGLSAAAGLLAVILLI